MFRFFGLPQRMVLSLAVAASVVAVSVVLTGAASAANAACPGASSSTANSCTFTNTSSTNAEQEFFVPAGVTSIDVHAVGAAASTPGSTGASGEAATVTGTLPLAAGTSDLWVEVGAVGGANTSSYAGSGGGESAVQTCSSSGSGCSYTADPSSDPRLIVAGGAGGGGQDNIISGDSGGAGGTAGTSDTSGVSGSGGPGTDAGDGGPGADAGYTLSKGTSGAPGAGSPYCNSVSSGLGDGAAGTPGAGGAGGVYGWNGGGGGDGWVGGAGGGADCSIGAGAAGGGGAGLSFIEASATGRSFGSTTEAAQVTISWKQPTTTSVSCQPDPVKAGNETTCTVKVVNAGADTGAGAPAGTVTFSASGQGKLVSTSCTLSGSPTATCSVSLKGESLGSATVTATYTGNDSHQGSSGKTSVEVAVKPTASTRKASGVKSRSATLHGSVKPGGAKTTYYFQYGTSKSYGSRTASHTLKAGASAKRVSAAIKGLRPGTTYHFRVVARNPVGTARGKDMTFTTAAAAGTRPPSFTG